MAVIYVLIKHQPQVFCYRIQNRLKQLTVSEAHLPRDNLPYKLSCLTEAKAGGSPQIPSQPKSHDVTLPQSETEILVNC